MIYNPSQKDLNYSGKVKNIYKNIIDIYRGLMKSLQASTWFPSSHLLLTKRNRKKKILFKLPLQRTTIHRNSSFEELSSRSDGHRAKTNRSTKPKKEKKPKKNKKGKKEGKKKEKKTGLISITTLKGYRRVPLK